MLKEKIIEYTLKRNKISKVKVELRSREPLLVTQKLKG